LSKRKLFGHDVTLKPRSCSTNQIGSVRVSSMLNRIKYNQTISFSRTIGRKAKDLTSGAKFIALKYNI